MMSGLTYSDDPVQWSVRITESGEYVHAAPWNDGIGQRSTSNGCTNLNTDDLHAAPNRAEAAGGTDQNQSADRVGMLGGELLSDAATSG